MRQEFGEARGREVGIGTDPLDDVDDRWVLTHSGEVMFLSVRKNYNYYPRYAEDPERYAGVVEMWRRRA